MSLTVRKPERGNPNRGFVPESGRFLRTVMAPTQHRAARRKCQESVRGGFNCSRRAISEFNSARLTELTHIAGRNRGRALKIELVGNELT